MQISYYLSVKEVKKALFKTFSSECAKWLNILQANHQAVEAMPGELKLAFDPATNSVLVNCKDENVHRELMAFAKGYQLREPGLKREILSGAN